MPCSEFPPVLWLVQRRTGRAFDAIVVLASAGDLDNYWKLCGGPDSIGFNHWNGELELGVVRRDLYEKQDDERDRGDALWVMARSLLDAGAPHDAWVRDGLAFALSCHTGDAAAPKFGNLRARTLSWWAKRLRDPATLDGSFLPIDELPRIGDAYGLLTLLSRRVGGGLPTDSREASDARYAFMVEAYLFTLYLWREEGGENKPLLVERLASLLGTKSATASPQKFDAVALQSGFVNFVATELAKMKQPESALPPELVEGLRKAMPGKKPSDAATGKAAPAGKTIASNVLDLTFEPKDLLELPLPPEARLGAALLQAGEGALDAAAATIETLANGLPAGDPLTARALRDVSRLRALAVARREFLVAACGNPKKLRFDHEGATKQGTVQELDGEVLLLSGAKGEVQRVALDTIGCEELLRSMTEHKREDGSKAVRSYAAVLAGRKGVAKEVTLRADVDETALLFATGSSGRIIEELAAAPLPDTAAAGESALERITKLLSSHRDEPLVVARLPLTARVENLGEGRVRLTCDWKDPKHAGDFAPVAFRSKMRNEQPLKFDEKASYMKQDAGELKMRGVAFWQSKLAFEAPLTCRYRFRYHHERSEPSVDGIICNINILVCDDGSKNWIGANDMSGIQCLDGIKNDYDKPRPSTRATTT
ncbi:MAG: hypothetical protein EXS13_12545 [Planctomycetes bacterium]|nr:hypothetical protein [Planctomycetota bacterium]